MLLSGERVEKLKTKTRVLNKLRLAGKIAPIERLLVGLAGKGAAGTLAQKCAPNNYQYRHGTMRECVRDGVRYSLDISDYMQYCIYFRVEAEPRDQLYDLVVDGTTVIDIGTNIGETLLNFARINKRGLNIGFEPVPFLYEMASRNIALNPFDNIRLENLGLSDTKQTLSFRQSNENNSGGIYLTPAKNASEGVVNVIPFDDYVAKNSLDNISLIKIDVEGFEMNVLRGASDTLRRFMPDLFVEINDGFLRRQGSSASELFSFLSTLGYMFRYATDGKVLDPGVDVEGQHFDIIASTRRKGS